MPEPASTQDRPTARAAACLHSMDGIRTEHIQPLLPDHVTEQYIQHRKATSGRDGSLTSADVVIALRIAVSGKYMPEADIGENGYVNALDARVILQAAADAIDL